MNRINITFLSGIFYLLLLGVFSGCNKELSPVDFFNKVSQDEDFSRQAEAGDFMLTCHYRPSELLCLKELEKAHGHMDVDKKEFEEEMKNFKNGCYIDFSISLKNGNNVMIEGISNQSEYAARLGELTYLLNNSCFMLADGKDSIKALNCLFSNTYGNSPVTRFMVIFPREQVIAAKKSIEVIYADRTFGIPEKVVFGYDPGVFIKKLPTIIKQKK